MTFPADFEEKIGFGSIRAIVAGKCLGAMGRRLVDEMKFSSDFETVSERLHCVAELLALISADADLPADDMADQSETLARLRTPGGFAPAESLFRLMSLMLLSARIRTSLCSGDSRTKTPALAARFDLVPDLREECRLIDSVVNRFGAIKDNASPRLAEIRAEKRRVEASMAGMVRRIIARGISEGILDKDTTAAVRDGRLVIPVAAANKRRISGIVHDESATGRTAFIEPAESVEAGNRLRSLELEERREEVVILTRLADSLRPHLDDIVLAIDYCAQYDFIRAKALTARDLDASLPKLEKGRIIEWYGARHPGLFLSLRSHGREVIPLSLKLDYDHRFLVISGPNAGGKSVALKTVGILQYMTQCGLLPTMHDNSHVGIFRNIMIDIGDEQSIENDLSTYSSHLRNMRYFLTHADKRSLLLADEMGSGTEPQLGGALAQAILAELAKTGCFGIITTHYHNLKTFAETTPGFVNGAMLYDRQHLEPLFQLSIGSAGSSFALEIARKSGLPLAIIDNAKELVGSDYVNLDKYLLDVARDKKYWADKRLHIRQLERRNEELTEQLEQKIAALSSTRKEIIGEARQQAKEILSETNALIENTISEIRRTQAEKERTKEVRKSIEDYKSQIAETRIREAEALKQLKPKNSGRKQNLAETEEPVRESEEFRPGDHVRMKEGGGVAGKILSIAGKEAEVAFGAIKTRIKLNKLKRTSAPKESVAQRSVGGTTVSEQRARQLNFSTELDLRGMRVDEALQAVTYFIDDAIRFCQPQVRILHGTGTGALRQAIRQYLSTHTGVASFRDEDVRFGGAGITVVALS